MHTGIKKPGFVAALFTQAPRQSPECLGLHQAGIGYDQRAVHPEPIDHLGEFRQCSSSK